MTQQTINVGASANDKQGDSLRAAFTKVNANFTELYATTYTPTTAGDWAGTAPTTVGAALDRLAAAVKALNATGA
tara:strand:- start:5755 stop:5979 length:225 start_codon:yes stop_codon:yes gene_type:complete